MAKSKSDLSVDQRPKLDAEFLSLPDEEMGRLLLSTYIESWATKRDLSSADSIAVEVLTEIKKGTISNIQYLPLSEALKTAATGDFSFAGNLAKQHFLLQRVSSLTLQLLAYAERQRLKGPKKAGQVSASKRQAENAERNKRICETAEEMKKAGKSSRNIPGILAERYDLSARQIRNILKAGKKNR